MPGEDIKTAVAVARLEEQVAGLQKTIGELVTKAEFIPVKIITFGLAGSVLGSVVTALIARVVIK